jgi:hypothetical protein
VAAHTVAAHKCRRWLAKCLYDTDCCNNRRCNRSKCCLLFIQPPRKVYKFFDNSTELRQGIVSNQQSDPEKALTTLIPNQHKTIIQLVHGWLPVNGQPGHTLSPKAQTCPLCQRCKETQQHFLTCTSHISQWQHILHEAGLYN